MICLKNECLMTGETIKRFGWLLTAAPNSFKFQDGENCWKKPSETGKYSDDCEHTADWVCSQA